MLRSFAQKFRKTKLGIICRIVGVIISLLLFIAGMSTLQENLWKGFNEIILPIWVVVKPTLPYIATFLAVILFTASVAPAKYWLRSVQWFSRRFGPFGDLAYYISCDGPLRAPDWKFQGDSLPEFQIIDAPDVHTERAVKIIRKAPYRLDYEFEHPIEQGRYVEFVGQFDKDSIIYIGMRLESKNKQIKEPMWLHVCPQHEEPRMHSEAEWHSLVDKRNLGKNWTSLVFDRDKHLPITFGTHGYVFRGITRFRIRGSMTLARIIVRKDITD